MRKEYLKTGLMAALVLLFGAVLFWEIAEYSRAVAANAKNEEELPEIIPGKELVLISAKKEARFILIEPEKQSISSYKMLNRKFRLVHTRNYKADFFFEDLADTPIESATSATVKDVVDYAPKYNEQQKRLQAIENRRKGIK